MFHFLRLITIISVFLFVAFFPQSSFALTRQLPLSGQLLTPGKLAVPDGDYTMRFAIYDKDRTSSDPYPSDADSASRIWSETQTVKVERGLWKVTLGSVTALPDSLNFETGNYYLGIRINADPEMVPRKKILPVPLALNAESLGGAKPGTGNNDILQLDSAGAINIAGNITTAGILQGANLIIGTSVQLPANSILTADIMDGTISTIDLADGLVTSVKIADSAISSAKLADSAVTVSKIGDGAITTIKLSDGSVSTAKLADLSVTTAKVADLSITAAKLATGDLHFQNTDTGTTSLAFGLGTGTAIGTNNFSLTASNAASKPAVRYNGTSGKWQISNDGTIFADIGSSLSSSLQAGYDAGNIITTTDARNLIFNLADTATDSSFIVNIQGSSNVFQIQDAGTPIFTVADGGISTFGGNINLSGNRITNASRIDGNASGSFLYTTVDVRQVYTVNTSLALDSSNYPHILYYTSDNSAAVISDWDGSQWTITDFDTVGTRGRNNDLVIDGAGVKHAVYQEEISNDSDLIYAKYVGSGGNCSGSSAWNCTIVDSTGDIATNSNSIDVDGSNIPHISYYDNTNGNLKHAWFVGSGGNCSGSAAWNCETVESANNIGSSSAIAINRANGNIHITYYDTTNGDLRYVKYSGGSWGTPVILDGSAGCIAVGCGTRNAGSYSYGSNLVLNASGNPRVSYNDYSSDDLYYGYSNDGGTTWATAKIDGGSGVTGTGCTTSGNYGQYSSLTLDSGGNPHISYYNYSTYDLRYASNNGSIWTCQTLDSANTVGLYSSIKMTSADKVYISYQDATNIDTKLVSNNYPKLNIYSDVAIMGETGNLGVGVLQPTERLDVAGNIKASGIISASDDLTAGDDLTVSDDAWIPTLFGSSSNNGALTLYSTSATPKGDIYINPGGQKTVIGNSAASASLATAGLQIAPNYLYIQYRYYNPGTGYTYSGNTGEANSYGGTPFTLVSAVGDMAYFGSYQPFNSLEIDLATLGVGGAVAWEYYGAAWASVAGLSDGTSNFTQDGIVSWTTALQSSSVNGYSAYWIRANVTTTGYTTAPTANSTIIGRFGTAAAPLVASLIQPAGIADSTTWSATGTMLGINTPSSFNGNFVDLQVAGSSKFAIASDGTVSLNGSNKITSTSPLRLTVNNDGERSMYMIQASDAGFGVGISDVSPDARLEVVTSAGAIPGFMVSSTSTGDGDQFIVNSIGNVGIGTASPGEKLEVVGNIISKGTSWTSRASAADNNWYSVAYGNGLFVAVACGVSATVCNYTAGNRVMTSPDGINWTIRTSAADNNWRSVAYGNGLFVAVASSGTGNRVMTSPDGINWTIRTSAADNDWRDVAYGNGLFVAVGSTGAGNRVMTSPDGINWTLRSSAADNSWYGLAYGNGLFVAVSDGGAGNRVMTSPDGINWTIRTSAADNYWYSVAYGNGLFVAVAGLGTGNRVMTSGKTELNFLAHNNFYQGGMNIFGTVGIGTSSPSEKLSILQNAAGTGILGLYDGANNNVVVVADGGSATFKPAAFDAVYNFDGASTYTDNTTKAKTSSDVDNAFAMLASEGSSDDEFYVGLDHLFNIIYANIATAGAGITLSAQYWNGAWTALSITDNTANLTADGTITFTAPSDWTTTAVNSVTKYWARLRSPGTNITIAPSTNFVTPTTANRFYIYAQSGDTVPALYLDYRKRVGINTTSPAGNLDIRQIADGNQVIYARRNTDTTPTGNFIQFQNAAGTSTLFSVNINGVATTSYMMVGTANSSYRFDAAYSGSGIIDVARIHNDTSAANNSGAQFLFGANRTTSGMTNIAGVAGLITDITQTAYKGALILSTANNAAPVEQARIDYLGNVSFGVNVASGTTTIDLGGTGTGNAVCHTTQTGTDNEGLVDCTSGPIADYAEMYPAASGVEYGDIVAVGSKMLKTKDGDNIVQLVKSSAPYQSTTIGIVSNNYGDFTSAGYNIKKEDNPMPVALSGRVPVKVSLENGPIAAGDPLTSSSTPGVAMKATGAGYIIGKALESFTELPTTNYSLPTKILVFVNPGWYAPLTGPLVQGGNNEFDTINIGSLATTKDLVVTGLARIKGDLIVEGKVRGDLEVEGIVKAKGIVGGWRSYENHFLNSNFQDDFKVITSHSEPLTGHPERSEGSGDSSASPQNDTGAVGWEYHKVKLATDAVAESKATLDHSFNFKPADDENGATWRFIVRVDPLNDLPDPLLSKGGQGVVRFGLYADEQNYALIQNGTEPQTMKFISCAVGECTTTDNIPVDPVAANRNYVVMIKQGEAKLLIDGQENAVHATNVPADSILHFYESVMTSTDAAQSIMLDYLGVIVGRYEPF